MALCKLFEERDEFDERLTISLCFTTGVLTGAASLAIFFFSFLFLVNKESQTWQAHQNDGLQTLAARKEIQKYI